MVRSLADAQEPLPGDSFTPAERRLFVYNMTPPDARTKNWFGLVDVSGLELEL
jgi:hypothetical protein